MKDVLGMNRGVFEMLDGVGLDVALDIENHYARVRPGQIPPEPAALLKSMVDAGTLGVRAVKGSTTTRPTRQLRRRTISSSSISSRERSDP
jgi:3-hydroxyacyl-CoA dehydrogenase